jgi:hypothetical protein
MESQRRAIKRQDLHLEASIVDKTEQFICRCLMVNVSADGARLTKLELTDVPEKFDLVLTTNGIVRRHCEVAWRSEKEIGVRFVASDAIERRNGPYKIDA